MQNICYSAVKAICMLCKFERSFTSRSLIDSDQWDSEFLIQEPVKEIRFVIIESNDDN